MRLIYSDKVSKAPVNPGVESLLRTISGDSLREWVQRISVPRHFVVESEQNRAIAKWLAELFASWNYEVSTQGSHANIVATPRVSLQGEAILVGAHYDSVPGSPGADDNGSAVAAMLGCAAACSLWRPVPPVVFVAFNREEEHLLGSGDFVETFLPNATFKVQCAHILEMVGYARGESGTQKLPTALPIQLPDRGDFLGLLANARSASALDDTIECGAAYLPTFPMIGLEVQVGVERVFPVLARSDHVPFWRNDIPAVMWTDTSEFRNPNYHQVTDTPETLDYDFLRNVTRALTATVIAQAQAT